MANQTLELEEWNGDGSFTLEQMAKMIPTLQKKYGKRAIVWFDAGFNNIEVKIHPTKKVKE